MCTLRSVRTATKINPTDNWKDLGPSGLPHHVWLWSHDYVLQAILRGWCHKLKQEGQSRQRATENAPVWIGSGQPHHDSTNTAVWPHNNQASDKGALIAQTCPHECGELSLTLPTFRCQPSHTLCGGGQNKRDTCGNVGFWSVSYH